MFSTVLRALDARVLAFRVILLLVVLDALALADVLPLRFAGADSTEGPEQSTIWTNSHFLTLLSKKLREDEPTIFRDPLMSSSERVMSFTSARRCSPETLTFADLPCISEIVNNPCLGSQSLGMDERRPAPSQTNMLMHKLRAVLKDLRRKEHDVLTNVVSDSFERFHCVIA